MSKCGICLKVETNSHYCDKCRKEFQEFQQKLADLEQRLKALL